MNNLKLTKYYWIYLRLNVCFYPCGLQKLNRKFKLVYSIFCWKATCVNSPWKKPKYLQRIKNKRMAFESWRTSKFTWNSNKVHIPRNVLVSIRWHNFLDIFFYVDLVNVDDSYLGQRTIMPTLSGKSKLVIIVIRIFYNYFPALVCAKVWICKTTTTCRPFVYLS